MPLRVRVTTTTGGAPALQWLATYVAIARLFDAKFEPQANGTDFVVDIVFPKKEAGTDYMNLLKPMNTQPLGVGETPVVRVEQV